MGLRKPGLCLWVALTTGGSARGAEREARAAFDPRNLIRVMPTKGHMEDIEPQLSAIFEHELLTLQSQWQLFHTLFQDPEQSEENYNLYNRISGGDFNIICDALSDSIAMGIARLRDKEKTLGHKNLSLNYFVNAKEYETSKTALKALRDKIEKEAENIEVWRNKIFSHNDLDTLCGRNRIDPLEYEDLDKLLSLLHDFRELLFKDEARRDPLKFGGPDPSFSRGVHGMRTNAILLHLKKGREALDKEHEKTL